MDIPPDRTAYAGEISDANPMGTDGFEFVEFTGPATAYLEALFTRMGFASVPNHRPHGVTPGPQGSINFSLTADPLALPPTLTAPPSPAQGPPAPGAPVLKPPGRPWPSARCASNARPGRRRSASWRAAAARSRRRSNPASPARPMRWHGD